MLSQIKKKLADEMCQLMNKQPLTKDDVVMIGELADAIKDISTAEGMSAYGVKYLDAPEESYAVRMPTTIHAVHPSHKYPGGYSGHSINDKMIASLEHIMDDATTDYERAQIQSEIDAIRMRGTR